MSCFSLVLENDILLEYEKFKRVRSFDKNKIENLLKYYKPRHLVNQEQIEFLRSQNLELDEDELTCIFQNGYANLSLEELASETLYKIILSQEKSNFPYVNISKDEIENNYTATFKANQLREKAFKHFKSLFKTAKSIFIYDNYLKYESLSHFINQCANANLKIYLSRKNYNRIQSISKTQKKLNIHIDISHQNYNTRNTHDRYVIVDYENYRLEIILTSGLDHLMNANKDFTYIIRLIN